MIIIRAWRRKDLAAIRQVAWDTWADAYGDFIPEADRRVFHNSYYTLDKLLHLFSSKIVEGCVAEIDSRIVGYSKTHWNDQSQQFFITSLYVLPEYQKQNLGKQMLEYGIETARGLNLDRVWLGVMVENKPAIQWYIRQGFIFIESKPFTIGDTTIDDLIGYKLI
ncbi:GNAT family N-acetyltransferase [bacterium]|nr:GNAT family N-acetyltransferase [bacterium]